MLVRLSPIVLKSLWSPFPISLLCPYLPAHISGWISFLRYLFIFILFMYLFFLSIFFLFIYLSIFIYLFNFYLFFLFLFIYLFFFFFFGGGGGAGREGYWANCFSHIFLVLFFFCVRSFWEYFSSVILNEVVSLFLYLIHSNLFLLSGSHRHFIQFVFFCANTSFEASCNTLLVIQVGSFLLKRCVHLSLK